jgi:hypothetical protein
MSNKIQHYHLDFIAKSLYMFRVLSVPIIRRTIIVVDSYWYNICYRLSACFVIPYGCIRSVQFSSDVFELINSYSLFSSVVPMAVNCSYCTSDDGYGMCLKHLEWSCNEIKILVLHLVGHFMCILTRSCHNFSFHVGTITDVIVMDKLNATDSKTWSHTTLSVWTPLYPRFQLSLSLV